MNHAEENAEAWAGSILELYQAYQALDCGAESAIADGNELTSKEDVTETVESMALTVEVRAPWHSPGDDAGSKPDQYRILLSWGGPSLQLVGELDQHLEPTGTPRMQIQDWGTPWTDYYPESVRRPDLKVVLSWFAGQFWFGG